MYKEASIFYFVAIFFWCSLFFKNISTPKFKTNKMVNSVVYRPCPQDYPQGYILSYFFKLLRVLSLSRMLVESFLTCIFHHVWKMFLTYGVHIPRKCIESMHFYSCLSPPLKTWGRIFWKSVSPKTKGVEETMICFIKIQSENMKMTWNISLFIFCMIFNFSKCDGFTVL